MKAAYPEFSDAIKKAYLEFEVAMRAYHEFY